MSVRTEANPASTAVPSRPDLSQNTSSSPLDMKVYYVSASRFSPGGSNREEPLKERAVQVISRYDAIEIYEFVHGDSSPVASVECFNHHRQAVLENGQTIDLYEEIPSSPVQVTKYDPYEDVSDTVAFTRAGADPRKPKVQHSKGMNPINLPNSMKYVEDDRLEWGMQFLKKVERDPSEQLDLVAMEESVAEPTENVNIARGYVVDYSETATLPSGKIINIYEDLPQEEWEQTTKL